jgi:hypothetical protein
MKLPELCAITSKKVGLAVGRRVSGGFAVLGGSRAAATEVPSCPAGIVALRRALAATPSRSPRTSRSPPPPPPLRRCWDRRPTDSTSGSRWSEAAG